MTDSNQVGGNTQLALQAPTDLQRQLDNYVANWNPQNNAPFSYAGPGQNLPILQGGPFQPPPLGLQFRPLATNQNLFLPSSIFSPTFNKQGTGTQQVGATFAFPTQGGLGPSTNTPPGLGGAPGAPMLGPPGSVPNFNNLSLGGIRVGGGFV